jgi:replication fork clamp-binding protein CrfC
LVWEARLCEARMDEQRVEGEAGAVSNDRAAVPTGDADQGREAASQELERKADQGREAASQEQLERTARAFFQAVFDVVPLRRTVVLSFAGVVVPISSQELQKVELSESPLKQSVDARRDVAQFMRTERVRRAVQPWPRLVRLLDKVELVAIRTANGMLYPLETLVQSPELLWSEDASQQPVEILTAEASDADLTVVKHYITAQKRYVQCCVFVLQD